MLKRSEPTLNAVDPKTRAALMAQLGLRDHPRKPLYTVLASALTMHINVVLALLRVDTEASIRLAAAVAERHITNCPPVVARARLPVFLTAPAVKSTDMRRVVKVTKKKDLDHSARRLLNTDLYRRLGLIRVGMTVEQLMIRGVKRRDLRIAQRRGWLKIEEKV